MAKHEIAPNEALAEEHHAHTFESYISDGERIMGVTFPDGRRREKLNGTTWRVRLLPFDFLGRSVVAKATLTLEKGGIDDRGEGITIRGITKEMDLEDKVTLTMEGALRPPERGDGAGARRRGAHVDAAVNGFLSDESGVGFRRERINDRVLENLQGSIEDNLLADYARWWRQCVRLEARRRRRPAPPTRARDAVWIHPVIPGRLIDRRIARASLQRARV